MDSYKAFHELIAQGAATFRTWNGPFRIISHLDADGICSASLMIKALDAQGSHYKVSIFQQLNEQVIKELSREDDGTYIFTDFGSGQFKILAENLAGKRVLILDHHDPEGTTAEGFIHINPHLAGITGDKEISGAGVVYLFTSELDNKNEENAHLAIIGAIGDVQEQDGFCRINSEILAKAVKAHKIEVKKGLRLFGTHSRPLYKALEYSTDVYIPGVSGSESGAVQFLQEIGINPKAGNDWTKLSHLTAEEERRLAEAIILRRLGQKHPENIFGNSYILLDEEPDTPLREAKEFSTLLNACGRMNKATLGIGACIGNRKSKLQAIALLNDYKKEIVSLMRWYEENEFGTSVTKGTGYVIINAQGSIPSTMIGTLASMLAKSGKLPEHTHILSMAWNEDGTTKVSLRISGINSDEDVDMRAIVGRIVEEVGGEAGGHKLAAGALIPRDIEDAFIRKAEEVLSASAVEERVRS